MISVHDVNHFVGSKRKGVIAMLAFARQTLQEMDFIGLKLVVVVGIDEPIKTIAIRSLAIHVETVVGIKKPHGRVEWDANLFDLFYLARAIKGHSEQGLIFGLR